jgi:thiamine-phosphate diphosphorylase
MPLGHDSDPKALCERLSVYLIADPDLSASGDIVADTEAALAAGAGAVQLRTKTLGDAAALSLAEKLLALCRAYGGLFFIDDRLDVALACGADGVHVGNNDLPVPVVRRLAGNRLIIGYSPETDEQAKQSRKLGADYVGIGSVFPTGSKPDAGEAIGLPALARRIQLAELPSVGIGGITAENAAEVIQAGACGVAVISAIIKQPDPGLATRRLVETVRAARRAYHESPA